MSNMIKWPGDGVEEMDGEEKEDGGGGMKYWVVNK